MQSSGLQSGSPFEYGIGMTRKRSHDGDVALDRTRETEKVEREHRYIFNGNTTSSAAGFAIRPNRKATRRSISTFNIILGLFGCGIIIVLYISNIIAVNHLALEVEQLRDKYEKVRNANAVLEAEINRKSGWERIGRMATELGLRHPTEQPTWFEVDESQLENIQTR